ncbi:MAG: dihydroorotate dehydrogenase electron transfer subunit [Candidatus Omnitrophota bacterium]|nr:dihydroorotate dehydrogenase electron transfer subunit [Candidatus Omnitrophota bacterium]
MKQLKVEIAENKKISQNFYRMRVESAYLAKNSKPGQFVEVKCFDGFEPLLRRPLGVHRILNNGIEILYEVVGKGTELLSCKRVGGTIDIIGPLGNGFSFTRSMVSGLRSTVLIAGGIGVAPLVALAESLAYSVQRIAYRKNPKIYVLIGAKTKSHILCADEFKKIGCKVIVSTEDGSMGTKGLATDLLEDLLSAKRYPLPPKADPPQAENAILYACGPVAMLRAVAKIAETKRIPCQVSMEERMACGVGVCLGCPVKVRTAYNVQRTALTRYAQRNTQYEYKMVCKDGPVFDAKEIMWER